MSFERSRPDLIYHIPIEGGELHVSPGFDFIHHYSWLDAWILKYWRQDTEAPAMANVVMHEKSAKWLVANCGLELFERTFITETELEHVRMWESSALEEVDFEPAPDEAPGEQ